MLFLFYFSQLLSYYGQNLQLGRGAGKGKTGLWVTIIVRNRLKFGSCKSFLQPVFEYGVIALTLQKYMFGAAFNLQLCVV